MADTAANWLGLDLARRSFGGPETANLSHVPYYGVFTASDGKLVTLGVAYEQHFWASLCDRLDLPDLRDLGAAARRARSPMTPSSATAASSRSCPVRAAAPFRYPACPSRWASRAPLGRPLPSTSTALSCGLS